MLRSLLRENPRTSLQSGSIAFDSSEPAILE